MPPKTAKESRSRPRTESSPSRSTRTAKTPDLREPKDKLEEISESDTSFGSLVRRRVLSALTYGEESREVFMCEKQLGEYYRGKEQQESSIRHFNAAYALADKAEATNEEKAALDLSLAESHFEISNSNGQDTNKHLKTAFEHSNRLSNAQFGDPKDQYRSELVQAKVLSKRNSHEAAAPHYDAAIQLFGKTNDTKCVEYGNLLRGAGENLQGVDNEQSSARFKEAYDIFISIGETKIADEVKKLLPDEEEQIQEEEEEEVPPPSVQTKETEEEKKDEPKQDEKAENKTVGFDDILQRNADSLTGGECINTEEEEQLGEEKTKTSEEDGKQKDLNMSSDFEDEA